MVYEVNYASPFSFFPFSRHRNYQHKIGVLSAWFENLSLYCFVFVATSIALIDNVETALVTNAASFGIDDWTISLRLLEITRDTAYWAIVFSVEGSGV